MGAGTYRVAPDEQGIRLDALLAQQRMFKSRSAAARAIEEGRVLVGGRVVAKRYAVEPGDAITYHAEEAVVHELRPSPIDLDIRYEDDDMIVLSKQVGLVCHPSPEHFEDTLVNALIHHCGIEHLCNVQGDDDFRRGIVHRLDRDTSGLMLAAKTDAAGIGLMDQIRNRTVDRHYIALVHGIVAVDSGMVDAPIGRHHVDRMRMAVSDAPNAREAVTTFKVLERYAAVKPDDGYTLLDCKLFTGRTHQIRVHMEYIKHPVVGDRVYAAHGPRAVDAQCGLERQFLHSYRLSCAHPVTGVPLAVHERCPEELERVLRTLEERSMGTTPYGREVADLLASAPQPHLPAFTAVCR